MHVDMIAFFQNLTGTYTDQEAYQHQLSMADMAEPSVTRTKASPRKSMCNTPAATANQPWIITSSNAGIAH